MTFICQESVHINSSNITSHQRTVTVTEIFTRLCSFETKDLVVLRKYLIELKLFCLLKIFPEDAQNSPSFLHSEKSTSSKGFPGQPVSRSSALL